MLVPTLAAIAVLLAISAFFSGAETALTVVSRGRMHQLEKDGSRAAAHVNRLVSSRERMIGAVLLGNTFINILTSSLATSVLEDHFGPNAVAITTAGMTVVILIFVETLPKTLAVARTDRVALFVAAPLRVIVALLGPVIATVQWLVWRVLWLFGVRAVTQETTEAAHEEIRGSIELHHQEGTVEREHRDMIGAVLDLRELQVGDVMRHRTSMESFDIEMPRRELIDAILRSQHSRIPLWKDEPENIVRILLVKNLAQALANTGGDIDALDMTALTTEPWFVPDTTRLEEQLQAFRKHQTRFALVVDEYGALQGLLTLEDIMEEILGKIPERADTRPDVRRRPDGSYLVDGTVPVRDLNRELDWHLPEEEATTIAGLVIAQSGTIPDVGQRFAYFGFVFEIMRRQRNQITALRIIPPAVPAAAWPQK
ncbi:MAG TPA: HlyC/CorC family transporter [Rhizomicrobium sp.]|jgi:Mg2+/Co2+ transporter CorB|nr:HlyC/CorC family transporter [Rhizomicrobium sp.]